MRRFFNTNLFCIFWFYYVYMGRNEKGVRFFVDGIFVLFILKLNLKWSFDRFVIFFSVKSYIMDFFFG